jgi:hypothetical protein
VRAAQHVVRPQGGSVADEETKQLLRQILETQKQHLDLVRGIDRSYEQQTKNYEQSSASYQEQLRTNRITTILHALTFCGIVAIVAYLVFIGFQPR